MTQFRPGGFSILPPVVKNLLIINGLFFLATFVCAASLELDLVEKLGLYYFGSDFFKPYQFVTHLFMHGGFWHLFSNMFALWMFGNALENVWGPKRFLTYYLITGLGAAFLHTVITSFDIISLQNAVEAFAATPTVEVFRVFVNEHVPSRFDSSFSPLLSSWQYEPNNPEIMRIAVSRCYELLELKKNIPTVGASGAVFGVLLAFGMIFPNQVIYLNFLFPIKAKYFVACYGLFELYAGIQNYEGDNVAHFAHLGGMIFGYFLIRYWNKQSNNFY
ncbi:rhomboid family intramembrane serine protease [Candidatus Amoebophilus asiaticus]|nr:rhomboid family intramembrane serine protease [Candidatus Amoebophilus asiaticus]